MTAFEHRPFVCDGRSPESLHTNDQARRQIVGSIAGLMHQKLDEDEAEEFRSVYSFELADKPKRIGAGLASTAPELLGEGSNQGLATPMMIEELAEGRFHPDPLDVGDGIAVLEESVELGVADVLTQV